MTEPERPSEAAREAGAPVGGTPSPRAVVGIGASAGGLGALRTFFSHVPEDSGLAFVVVVHLSPEHESHLADLLQPHIKIPVLQVTDTMQLEPDHVYVIPPGANLSAVDTHLRLSQLEESRRARAPIDHFLRTLGATYDGHSIGVILTGTGSDGALGIRAVKEKNGLTVAQDPADAEYDGMPRSAIATGMVDLVLPVAAIPAALQRFASTDPNVRIPRDGEQAGEEERLLLQKLFTQLRARTGRDFSRYKRSTLVRRVRRRMQLAHTEKLAAYLDRLRADADEVRALADDLLITVTNFFRDAVVWERLEREVVPALFERKELGQPIRAWSVGCATGEEAYSLAMLLIEEGGRRDDAPPIQVFASDLHERSLERAREGFYPGDVAADVSAERLARFFHKEDGGYRVNKEVRERVVFAPHNLLGDPPFSRMDLISCRNVLIYLQADAQRDVLDIFHYALVPDGFLVLGTSETIDGSAELFRLLDKTHHVWRKRNVRAGDARLPTFAALGAPAHWGSGVNHRSDQGEPMAYGPLHERLVERYAPPSMLVSPADKVAHLSAHAGRYLEHPGGELTSNAFKLVREELRIELRAALHAAREKGQVTRSNPIPVRLNGEVVPVVLHVRPSSENEFQGFFLVIFDELEPLEGGGGDAPSEGGGDLRSDELRTELDLARQRTQAIIEEYETTQEEMRASQEELQSSNEELRSALEELETSKEELQSVNEELQTVNQENRHKVEELSQLSGDLQNLFSSTDIATLFLDRTFRILRFTPRVGEIFNVRPVDRGRPLSDLTHRLGYDALQSDAETVLRTLVPVEREVQDERGRWYMSRVLPYRTSDDRIGGLVLTFVDITLRKRAQEEVEEARVYAESIVETLHEPLLVLHPDLRVRTANQAFYDQFLVNRADTVGRLVYELGNGQWDIPALRTLLEEVLPDNNVFRDFEVGHDFADIGERFMLVNARRLDHVQLILLGIRDITERKRAEEALRASEARHAFVVRLEDVLRPLGDAAAIQDAAARVVGEHLGVSCAMYAEVDGEPGAEIGITRGVYVADPAMPRFPERYSCSVFGARVMSVRQPPETIVIADVTTDPQFDTAERDAWAASGVRAAITVPLVKDGCFIAEFAVQSNAPRHWTANDIALVQETAERTWAAVVRARAEAAMRHAHAQLEARVQERTAALAATNASLETQIRERRAAEAHIKALFSRLVTAQEEERRRIARDVHDQLGQQITALRMSISALHSKAAGAATTAEQITRTEALAEELDRAIDFLTWELRPAALDHLGLSAALAHLVSGWSERFGIQAEFATSGLDGTRFTPDVETNLHRLTQEALHNIYKHANASHVSVLLEQRDARLVLIVEDDGVGFSVGSNKGVDVGSFGLVNMRERATLAGGELTIDSTPGHGTTLIVRVPLGSDDGPRDDNTEDPAR